MLDPTLFTVEQKKQMGMWPPGEITGLGLLPYFKRMKTPEIEILEVGIEKGENASYLLENTQASVRGTGKIKKIFGIKTKESTEDDSVLFKNIGAEWFVDRFQVGIEGRNEPFDVVCINSSEENLDEVMKQHYDMLKSGGIFCGNDHAFPHVKEALSKFRRSVKIGELMHISRGSYFWYKR